MSMREADVRTCASCKHYIGIIEEEPEKGAPTDDVKFACKAFPDGIPEEIWNGENLHRSPVTGDGGVVYAQRERR